MRKAVWLVIAASVAMPTVAWAQASVQSDTPVPRRSDGLSPGSGTLPRSGAARDSGVPNALTGPGSPAATGTGAAGTGPSGTMVAPGR